MNISQIHVHCLTPTSTTIHIDTVLTTPVGLHVDVHKLRLEGWCTASDAPHNNIWTVNKSPGSLHSQQSQMRMNLGMCAAV